MLLVHILACGRRIKLVANECMWMVWLGRMKMCLLVVDELSECTWLGYDWGSVDA